jgi:hypothetical protein
MLRRIHGTNFFHIKFSDRPNIKCQNGPVLPPAQVFYFNGQALQTVIRMHNKQIFLVYSRFLKQINTCSEYLNKALLWVCDKTITKG